MCRSRSSSPPLACGLAPIRRSPFGRQFGQFRHEPAVLVEKFFWLVAFHPAFKLLEMIGMLRIHQERHLVRAKGALDLQAIDDFRSRPAFRRLEDDHRPARSRGDRSCSRALLWICWISSMALSRAAAIS